MVSTRHIVNNKHFVEDQMTLQKQMEEMHLKRREDYHKNEEECVSSNNKMRS